MAKSKTGKNTKVERRGDPVDLVAWLNETKVEDGKEVPANLSAAIHAELKDGKQTIADSGERKGRVVEILSENYSLTIELSKRKFGVAKEAKHYDMEYADLLPRTMHGCTFLVGGKLDPWFAANKSGDGEKEQPSVTKYFAQGFSMVARNAASTRLQAAVEGPDKLLNQTIARLQKQKGYDLAKATRKAKAMMAILESED